MNNAISDVTRCNNCPHNSTFMPGSLMFNGLQYIGTGTDTSPLLPFAPSVEYRAGKLQPYACIRPSDIPSCANIVYATETQW